MSDIRIRIPLTVEGHAKMIHSWKELTDRAREAGIHLTPSGLFTGTAQGSVKLDREHLDVVVTDKPFYVSERAIREALEHLVSDVLKA